MQDCRNLRLFGPINIRHLSHSYLKITVIRVWYPLHLNYWLLSYCEDYVKIMKDYVAKKTSPFRFWIHYLCFFFSDGLKHCHNYLWSTNFIFLTPRIFSIFRSWPYDWETHEHFKKIDVIQSPCIHVHNDKYIKKFLGFILLHYRCRMRHSGSYSEVTEWWHCKSVKWKSNFLAWTVGY